MTKEEFENDAQDIKDLMMCFYRVRDRAEKRKLKKLIIYYVHNLLKV